MHMKYMLVNIQIIHCLNNKIPMQNTENKIKYIYTEQLQLLKKMRAAKKNAVVNFRPGILTNLFSLPLRKIMCVNLKAIREYCYIGTGHEVQFTRPLKFGIYTAHAELKNQTNQPKQTVKKTPTTSIYE